MRICDVPRKEHPLRQVGRSPRDRRHGRGRACRAPRGSGALAASLGGASRHGIGRTCRGLTGNAAILAAQLGHRASCPLSGWRASRPQLAQRASRPLEAVKIDNASLGYAPNANASSRSCNSNLQLLGAAIRQALGGATSCTLWSTLSVLLVMTHPLSAICPMPHTPALDDGPSLGIDSPAPCR